jgi:toxin-antitoxin system PIN domain toxin
VVVVDTNVLIYAANVRSPFHKACQEWLDDRRGRPDAWYCTWPIVYEFLRITTHPNVLNPVWPISEAWDFIIKVLDSPGCGLLVPTERHTKVASQVFGELRHLTGNLMHDAHTAILMREHGVRQICTRDSDFYRFPFLEVFDPVAGPANKL